jgi:hypothetical protein
MPAVSADDPALLEFLEHYGWLRRPAAGLNLRGM